MLEHSVKGQLTIIETAREAATLRPDWHFLLLGSGDDEALFRREIAGLENIELVGFVDNVGDYLASFDLFVFPSLHEALHDANVAKAAGFSTDRMADAYEAIYREVL